jgi:hypothetical protein
MFGDSLGAPSGFGPGRPATWEAMTTSVFEDMDIRAARPDGEYKIPGTGGAYRDLFPDDFSSDSTGFGRNRPYQPASEVAGGCQRPLDSSASRSWKRLRKRRLSLRRILESSTTSYSPLSCSSSPRTRSRSTMIERWMRKNVRGSRS